MACAGLAAYLQTAEALVTDDSMKNTIAIYLEENPKFATFMGLVKFSALYQDLHRSKNITVMALPNEVFQGMKPGHFEKLINETRETIKVIIENHIIEDRYKARSLIHGSQLQTMNGSSVVIYNKDGILKINNSLIVKPDIRLSNGVLHILDSMIRYAYYVVA